MIKLKSEEEIAIMEEGGRRLREAVRKLKGHIKKGVTTKTIDQLAEKFIIDQGGEPSFKKVPGYHWTICVPINEQVVHTPPSERVLQEGDVFTLDIGMYFKGFHTDFARTWIIGKPKNEQDVFFLEVGRKAHEKALQQVGRSERIGEISEVIEKEITKHNLFIMKNLTGHGIGRDLHEDPSVPGHVDRSIKKTAKVEPGLVIAVEVIYARGTSEITYEEGDVWSIKSKDNSLTACFEDTIAVTGSNTVILT